MRYILPLSQFSFYHSFLYVLQWTRLLHSSLPFDTINFPPVLIFWKFLVLLNFLLSGASTFYNRVKISLYKYLSFIIYQYYLKLSYNILSFNNCGLFLKKRNHFLFCFSPKWAIACRYRCWCKWVAVKLMQLCFGVRKSRCLKQKRKLPSLPLNTCNFSRKMDDGRVWYTSSSQPQYTFKQH